jgi:hypothetical protein
MAKNLTKDTKVPAPSGKPDMGTKVSQKITGKLKGGTQAMPGSKGLGQAVKTVKSNPIQGENVQRNTSMGSGAVIDPFV